MSKDGVTVADTVPGGTKGNRELLSMKGDFQTS